MALVLFTDFGANDLYVGQVEAVLDRLAPGVRVIHLLHEAPRFNIRASAHLLAALTAGLGRGHVIIGVVDPGVGTDRPAVVVKADDNWYVGPDNGLFAVLAVRAAQSTVWRIVSIPATASASFHGRDVFAPLAAAIAAGAFPTDDLAPSELAVALDGDDLAEVIYLDHYGNAFTGVRAAGISPDRQLVVNGRVVRHARVFAATPPGTPFWYGNSSGLVEIAVNLGSAAAALGLQIGTPIAWQA
jgi:hypothetical protein